MINKILVMLVIFLTSIPIVLADSVFSNPAFDVVLLIIFAGVVFFILKEQIQKFFNSIQAGVIYANRAASATTAASPQSQPFVGWKGSGISGKGAGGRYYLQQFMREQTQTVCE